MAQESLGLLAHSGFAMAMHADTPVAQESIECDLEDVQTLCNFVDAKLLFEVECFGNNGRALYCFGEAPLAAANPAPRPRRSQSGVGALANQLPFKFGQRGKQVKHEPAHKVDSLAELVGARGARLLYLPPYSPGFSPIERVFSTLKTGLRTAQARTRDALEAIIQTATEWVTEADAKNWFDHCGFHVH